MSKKAGPIKSSGYGQSSKKAAPAGGKQPGGSKRAARGAAAMPAAAAAAEPVTEKHKSIKMEQNRDFELPAISILMRKKTDVGAEWIEKRKKKMVRQNVPAGEDTKKLKDIVKSLKNQEINVHEFVGLVAPSTGDNALTMRNILAEEMTTFRKMCRRVYDTMTQDVSDVLANEQVQLTDNCNERQAMYSDKMMRSIDEIFAFIPDFDFEMFYEDEDYLTKKFPLCVTEALNADEEESLMRQEAFHRYQWLRSEGDRLAAENARLQNRLGELKRLQKDEMQRAQDIQVQAEERREQLEVTEEALQEKVEELNKSIDEKMVANEISVMKKLKKSASMRRGHTATAKEKKKKKLEVRPEWNVGAAQEVEEQATEQVAQSQISQVSMSVPAPPTPSTGAVRKQPKQSKVKKSRFQRPPPQPQDADPFHYSPPKTPPGFEVPQQQTSPFHFSPNRRSPSAGGASAMGRLPGQSPHRTVRMETSTSVMEPTRIPKGPAYSHHRSTKLW